MDWNHVAWAAFGGAVGGGLGAALASLVANRLLKKILVIVPMLLLAQGVPWLLSQRSPAPANKLEHAVRLSQRSIEQSVPLAQILQGKSAAEALALSREKSRAGLKRLSPEDLMLWNRLRLAIAERSPALCAGYWTGRGSSPQLLADALNQMEQSDVDGFVGIGVRATVAEVENKAFEPPSRETFAAALTRIKEGLPRPDAERLDRVLGQGMRAAPEDACWAVKLFMRDSGRLPPPDQERFLRYMASL